MYNIANIITFSRIICSILIILIEPFSISFWLMYIYCGISDILDGYFARKYKSCSVFGARLDSIADMLFLLIMGYYVIVHFDLVLWVYLVMSMIMAIKLVSYIIGYVKFKSFCSLHTYLNKLSGFVIFIGLFFYQLNITLLFITTITFISSIEELIIIIIAKKLNLNNKSIFDMKKNI